MKLRKRLNALQKLGRKSQYSNSNWMLLQEFLRRTARLAVVLDHFAYYPFENYPIIIDSELPSLSQEIKEVIESIHCGGSRGRIMLKKAVEWEMLDTVDHERFPENPYEPLLIFYERGGYFDVENRMIIFDGGLFPIKPIEIAMSLPPLDLRKENLDILDLVN